MAGLIAGVAVANAISSIHTRMNLYNRNCTPAGIWFDRETGNTSLLLHHARLGPKG